MAMFNHQMVYSVSFTGWWLTYPSEKYESVGMIIPNIWENKMHVPNHQPDSVLSDVKHVWKVWETAESFKSVAHWITIKPHWITIKTPWNAIRIFHGIPWPWPSHGHPVASRCLVSSTSADDLVRLFICLTVGFIYISIYFISSLFITI